MFETVLNFWFVEAGPKRWWVADPQFDEEIRRRFTSLHDAARAGELWAWRTQPLGRLAEIVVLDQFSRNLYRDSARAFENDTMALVLAQEAVTGGHDQHVPHDRRHFVYMPYEHSESKRIHQEAVRLFDALGSPDLLDFELRHKAIIDRFGRYPHRNEVLGRPSTSEELEFLKQPGSRF